MTYTATDAYTFRTKQGSLSEKICAEFSSIDSEIDTVITTADSDAEKSVVFGSSGATLAGAGFDVADGTGGTTYGVFVAPFAITVTGAFVVMTEAYVKDTDDATVSIVDNAAEANTIGAATLTAEGIDQLGTLAMTLDETSVAAGTVLNVVVSATAASTGTGHALVVMKYKKA